MRAKNLILAGLMISTAAFVTGCGGDDNNNGFVTPPPPVIVNNPINVINQAATLTVSPNPVTRQVGETQQFTATATFNNGVAPQDVTNLATWTSSNPAIATINNTGLATAVAPGIVTIRASGQVLSATSTLTVGTPSTFLINFSNPVNTNVTQTTFGNAVNLSSSTGTFTATQGAPAGSQTFTSNLALASSGQGNNPRSLSLVIRDNDGQPLGTPANEVFNIGAGTPGATLVLTETPPAGVARRFVATSGSVTVLNRVGNQLNVQLNNVGFAVDPTLAGNTGTGTFTLSGPATITGQ